MVEPVAAYFSSSGRYTRYPVTVVASLDALLFWACGSPARVTSALFTTASPEATLAAIAVNVNVRDVPAATLNPAGRFQVSVRPSVETDGSPAAALLLPGL